MSTIRGAYQFTHFCEFFSFNRIGENHLEDIPNGITSGMGIIADVNLHTESELVKSKNRFIKNLTELITQAGDVNAIVFMFPAFYVIGESYYIKMLHQGCARTGIYQKWYMKKL